ncbi:MAG TPA: Uma2 family endonuclease, partial [Spirochaetia bacterium]|nr:Uma2 family endonuclease [Spirochaetia bacterium]
MSLAVKHDHIYTYADYLSWEEGKRWELIEGTVYDMSPAPSRVHQSILGELFFQMKVFLKNKSCSIFPAP